MQSPIFPSNEVDAASTNSFEVGGVPPALPSSASKSPTRRGERNLVEGTGLPLGALQAVAAPTPDAPPPTAPPSPPSMAPPPERRKSARPVETDTLDEPGTTDGKRLKKENSEDEPMGAADAPPALSWQQSALGNRSSHPPAPLRTAPPPTSAPSHDASAARALGSTNDAFPIGLGAGLHDAVNSGDAPRLAGHEIVSVKIEHVREMLRGASSDKAYIELDREERIAFHTSMLAEYNVLIEEFRARGPSDEQLSREEWATYYAESKADQAAEALAEYEIDPSVAETLLTKVRQELAKVENKGGTSTSGGEGTSAGGTEAAAGKGRGLGRGRGDGKGRGKGGGKGGDKEKADSMQRIASTHFADGFSALTHDGKRRLVNGIIAAFTFFEHTDMGTCETAAQFDAALEEGLPSLRPLQYNAFRRGDGRLPLSIVTIVAIIKLMTEGKMDPKAAEMVMANTLPIYDSKKKTLAAMSERERDSALKTSTAIEVYKRAGLDAALNALKAKMPDMPPIPDQVAMKLALLNEQLAKVTPGDNIDKLVTWAAARAIAEVAEGTEQPPTAFDETAFDPAKCEISTVGLRMSSPKQLDEMKGVIMTALCSLPSTRLGIITGSTLNANAHTEFDMYLKSIDNNEEYDGTAVAMVYTDAGCFELCGVRGKVIFPYAQLGLVDVWEPPLKVAYRSEPPTKRETHGLWKTFLLTTAPPHGFLGDGLGAWEERYLNQAKLLGTVVGVDVPAFHDFPREPTLIEKLKKVEGEQEVNDDLPAFGFRCHQKASAAGGGAHSLTRQQHEALTGEDDGNGVLIEEGAPRQAMLDQFDFKDPQVLQPGHFALYRMHTKARQKQIDSTFYSLIEIRMPNGGVSAALEKNDFKAKAQKYGTACHYRTLRVRHPNFFR